jgi:hypothetical protein
LVAQASQYCEAFFAQFANGNLLGLLQLFEDPSVQSLSPVTRFYLLQKVQELTHVPERYHQATQDSRQSPQVQQWLLHIVRDAPQVSLASYMYLQKFAVIFVNLIRNVFPESWPTAFEELLQIMTSTQDVNLLKVYLKFILTVLITLDEELVERFDQHDQCHNFIAIKVKDGVRTHAIGPICQLLA